MKTLIILILHIVILLPGSTVRITNNASEWFDGEIAEKIHAREKLHKKIRSTKLRVDKEIY